MKQIMNQWMPGTPMVPAGRQRSAGQISPAAAGTRQSGASFRTSSRLGSGFGARFRLAATGLFACALLAVGCSKDVIEPSGDLTGGLTDGLTTIVLTPESMGDVTMDTRSLTGVDENTVKDLWVIQLNSYGSAQLVEPQYFSGADVINVGNKCNVKIKIKSEASRLYFIANTGSNSLFNGVTTESAIQAKTLSVTNEASLAPNNVLPMSGYFSGTPTATNLGDGSIKLTRAVSKVTFKLASAMPDGGKFTLTSVKLKNVPKVLHYWRDQNKLDPGTTAANCYPATSAGFIDEWMDLTPSDKTLSATPKDLGWCYLPENGRGTGTATDQKNKDADHALGGAKGQGNYATYIEVSGDYTGPHSYNTYTVAYRIYLGSDNLKDYNVVRNMHYTVTTTIKGPSDFDTRIETTFKSSTEPDVWDYTETRTGWFVAAAANVSTGIMEWAKAAAACPEGWRLPSLFELEIMYCMRDTWASNSNGFTGDYDWSATEASITSYNGDAWGVNFNYGVTRGSSKSYNLRVRCIRDLL